MSAIALYGAVELKDVISDLRKPHALQSVLAPSGPLRHSGVSALLQLWHLPGGAALCFNYKVSC